MLRRSRGMKGHPRPAQTPLRPPTQPQRPPRRKSHGSDTDFQIPSLRFPIMWPCGLSSSQEKMACTHSAVTPLWSSGVWGRLTLLSFTPTSWTSPSSRKARRSSRASTEPLCPASHEHGWRFPLSTWWSSSAASWWPVACMSSTPSLLESWLTTWEDSTGVNTLRMGRKSKMPIWDLIRNSPKLWILFFFWVLTLTFESHVITLSQRGFKKKFDYIIMHGLTWHNITNHHFKPHMVPHNVKGTKSFFIFRVRWQKYLSVTT